MTLNEWTRSALMPLIAALLPACDGGGGSGSGAFCQSIDGGSATVTSTIQPNCANCTITNLQAAADGNPDTYASISAGSSAPGVSDDGVHIRATAQSGVVYPAGSMPTVYISGANGNLCRTMATYLDGNRQEGGEAGFCFNESNGQGMDSLEAFLTFDAVEFRVRSNQVTGNITIRINEICSNP